MQYFLSKALIAVNPHLVLPYPVAPTIVPLPLELSQHLTDFCCRSVLVILVNHLS